MPLTSTDLIATAEVTWLTLCGMMLFSRFIFQAAGPRWMRRFLDGWKFSRTHRLWGMASLIYSVAMLAAMAALWRDTLWVDRGVVLSLVLVLAADGLLNLLPSWFGNFKERMQDSWVKRHGNSERGNDRHLFGSVNFLLGFASAGVGGAIYYYRPLDLFWLGIATMAAVGIMSLLIVASRIEAGRRR